MFAGADEGADRPERVGARLGRRGRAVGELIMETYAAWYADRTLRLGAGLAYYALLTIVPFLALTAALAEPLFGEADVESFIAERLAALGVDAPDAAANDVMLQISARGSQTSLGIIGAVSLLFAATVLFLALIDAVNTIWAVPARRGWRYTVRRRLIAFLMVLVSSAAVVAQFAISAVVGAAEALFPGDLPAVTALAPLITDVAALAALTLMVTLLLRYLAPQDVRWRVAASAGVVTALLLVLGSDAVAWYLRNYGGGSVVGAFGTILAFLTWVFLLAQILLAGVQLSKVLTRRAGSNRS